MVPTITPAQLCAQSLDPDEAELMARRLNELLASDDPSSAWAAITAHMLNPAHPFALHRFLFEEVFDRWDHSHGPPPAWTPAPDSIEKTNIGALMQELGIDSYGELHEWSVRHRDRFWQLVIDALGIQMARAPSVILDSAPIADADESVSWLVDAGLNIADSCFSAPPNAPAIFFQHEGGALRTMTCQELEVLTNRVANGVVAAGLGPGDPVAICMPMTVESVAIYLGLVRAGCVVVSIADSFSAGAIARRIRMAGAKAIFTQEHLVRGGKQLPLYAKVVAAEAPHAVVLPADGTAPSLLRGDDLPWGAFLSDDDVFDSVVCGPEDHTNILFSSGTTGDPKAIPWTQMTPIKCAADAYLHQNIQSGDVVAWPTNLGWMMGPWLIYASLINRAAMALFDGLPTGREFGQFIQDGKVTMFGVVPSLVSAWRQTGCMDGLDWSAIKAFSSTGECSDPDDMLWLMSRAGYRPVIEYCGGTEIGGGYIAGTLVQPASPATFSTPVLGLDLVILDEQGRDTDEGELFIVPPSIGLSQQLVGQDHHEVYFEETPVGPNGQLLRRHGDQMRRLGGGYFRALGRADDTMNLGGIKVSSAEIERVLNAVEGVGETAAIAVDTPGGGPSRLVIFAVPARGSEPSSAELRRTMQSAIRENLNPLFKVHDVLLFDALPRTASNKVMRRELRAGYGRGGQ